MFDNTKPRSAHSAAEVPKLSASSAIPSLTKFWSSLHQSSNLQLKVPRLQPQVSSILPTFNPTHRPSEYLNDLVKLSQEGLNKKPSDHHSHPTRSMKLSKSNFRGNAARLAPANRGVCPFQKSGQDHVHQEQGLCVTEADLAF